MVEKAKLNNAFRRMRRAGLMARQRYACCTSCASSLMEELAGIALDYGEKCLGYAYYHIQSEESRRAGEDFYIGFGPAWEADDKAVRSYEQVGQIICECLSKAGVPHDWNGDRNVKVRIIQTAAPQTADCCTIQ